MAFRKVRAQWASGPILSPHLPRGNGQWQRGADPAQVAHKVWPGRAPGSGLQVPRPVPCPSRHTTMGQGSHHGSSK